MAFWDFLTRLLQPAAQGGAGGGLSGEGGEASGVAVEAVVVLTQLFGDDGGAATDAVAEALSGIRGVTVHRAGGDCGEVDDSEVLPASLAEATRRARRAGAVRGAHAIVFGQRVPGGLRLRFTPGQIEGDAAFSTILAGDFIDVPWPLGERADLIPACAVAALACPTDPARRHRLDRLRGLMPAMERQCQALTADPAKAHAAASASLCYAAMVAEPGFRAEQRPLLDQAMDITRAALARGKDSLTSSQVAAARVRYGDIMMKVGIDDDAADLLEEAARHFRTAADVFTAETFPDEYALLRAQAGRALHRLAVTQGKTALMKEAVQAYFEATRIWSKGHAPDRWAEMQQNMGAVMSHLGEFSGNAEVLNRACKLFEGASDVWTRDKNPRRWASLMNNIGACRFAQGKRSGELPALREASECFARALEVYVTLGMSRNVFVTQKNLARVDRLISVQEGRD